MLEIDVFTIFYFKVGFFILTNFLQSCIPLFMYDEAV